MLKKIYHFIIIWLVGGLLSCSQSSLGEQNSMEDSLLRLQVSLNNTSEHTVLTRTASQELGKPVFFIFTRQGGTEELALILDESSQQVLEGDDKTYLLSFPKPDHELSRIGVLLNSSLPDSEELLGLDLSSFLAKLTFDVDELKANQLPLWGDFSWPSGVQPPFTLNIDLIRGVASVCFESKAAEFVVSEVLLYGSPEQGLLAQDGSYPSHSFVPKEVSLSQECPLQASDGQYHGYLAESSLVDGQQPTKLIVKGAYQGVESYYALEFKEEDSGEEFLEIIRNHRYLFTLEKVNRKGWGSAAEAYHYGSASDLDYSVALEAGKFSHVWHQNQMYFYLVDDEINIHDQNTSIAPARVSCLTNFSADSLKLVWDSAEQSAYKASFELDEAGNIKSVQVALKSRLIPEESELLHIKTISDVWMKTLRVVPQTLDVNVSIFGGDANLHGYYHTSLTEESYKYGEHYIEVELNYSAVKDEYVEVIASSETAPNMRFVGVVHFSPLRHQTSCKLSPVGVSPDQVGKHKFTIQFPTREHVSVDNLSINIPFYEYEDDIYDKMLRRTKMLIVTKDPNYYSNLILLLETPENFSIVGGDGQMRTPLDIEYSYSLPDNVDSKYHIVWLLDTDQSTQELVSLRNRAGEHPLRNLLKAGGAFIHCANPGGEEVLVDAQDLVKELTCESLNLSYINNYMEKAYLNQKISYFFLSGIKSISEHETLAAFVVNDEDDRGPYLYVNEDEFNANDLNLDFYSTKLQSRMLEGKKEKLGDRNKSVMFKDKDNFYYWFGTPRFFQGGVVELAEETYAPKNHNAKFVQDLVQHAVMYTHLRHKDFNRLNKSIYFNQEDKSLSISY
mgnify:CR=1 FL=1